MSFLLRFHLQKPDVNKQSENGENGRLSYGVSTMQGWRPTQEDAHICLPDFDKDTSLFAIFDGHGGNEVAQYCSEKLPDFIKNTQAYQDGNMVQALTDGFLSLDASIITPDVIQYLKTISKPKDPKLFEVLDDEKEKLCQTYWDTVNKLKVDFEKSQLDNPFAAGSSTSSCNQRKEDPINIKSEDETVEETKSGPGWESGCAAIVALLRQNKLYVANLGDSRCIICRNGLAVPMSTDHKPTDKIERNRIVKAGGTVSYEGRINFNLNLSRSFGDHVYKQNKSLPATEQMITALPEITSLTLTPETDEYIFLACDGIWDCMSRQEVVAFIKHMSKPIKRYGQLSDICESMFDDCMGSNPNEGGSDNMTAMIVQFKNDFFKKVCEK